MSYEKSLTNHKRLPKPVRLKIVPEYIGTCPTMHCPAFINLRHADVKPHLIMRTMRTKSPEKKLKKLKPRSNDVNPETALEYFQISVNVLEARKLAWASPHSTNSYVVVLLGKDKHRTSIKNNCKEPCYREYFLFEWYATVREVQHTSLWLAVMEPKCCAPPRLLGETSIDLTTIWEQPDHQVFHKWAQLSLPREPEAGAVGFLKVDISIVCRGDAQVMPVTVNQDIISKRPVSSNLVSSDQQNANYIITVYGAFGIPCGTQGQGDRRYGKSPSTYVKVSFCGLSCKTAVQYRNSNPAYSEQISIVEAFPNLCQLVRFEVCSAEVCFNNVLASADLRLGLISHDGENGFVPTFGPSLLQMYGNDSTSLGTSGENGPYYKGALLVALKTVVPYYQQGLRSTNVEPVTPMHMDDVWTWENFSIFCPILEVSMLDKRIISKFTGVALTVGEISCTYQDNKEFMLMTNEIKTKKLHYTGPLGVTMTSSDYSHVYFNNEFPVLQLATCLPDFRFRIFINNMVRDIATDLENSVNAIEKKFKRAKFSVLGGLVDELRDAVDNTATSLRKFLDIDGFTENPGRHGDSKCYETELDHKQLALQKEEIKKICLQMSKKIKCNSTLNLTNLFSKTSRDGYAGVTKKEVKSLLAEANKLVQKIFRLVFTSPEGWPDIVIWLLNNHSRVGYFKISLADVVYSDMPNQSGKHCGRVQTIYLKPLKCSKHLNTLASTCTCIAGRIEMLVWMGSFKQRDVFHCSLPKAYKLKTKDFCMSLKTTSMMLQCRVFISRAKLNVYSENASLPSPFVRVHALSSVQDTKVESFTVTPNWNAVLKIQSMAFISRSRLTIAPPTILVEVFDDDISARREFIGCVEIQPAVDDRPHYEYAPKLQWHALHRGSDKIGEILMSAQLLQVPETLVKSTIYTVDEVNNDAGTTKESMTGNLIVEELPACLRPKPNTYKVDIYWWGLRDVSGTRKPCAVLEIDELTVKSDIITEGKSNCNFPSGHSSHVFEAPLNEVYCPPLVIRIFDCNTFGRTLFMGTNAIKDPNKYMVDWIPKYVREASLKSASIMSANFLRVSDNIYIKKSITSSEVITEHSKLTVSTRILQTHKTKAAWRSLFCRNEPDEEEFVLLPLFTTEKESFNVAAKAPIPATQDWWFRFFDSLKGRSSEENINLNKIKIYHSELETQPEFNRFKDWCKTLKLYSGKKSGIAEKDTKHQCGFIKVGIAIYNWPPPSDIVVVNSSGIELAQGFFDDHPLNETTKYLIRVYVVRGINLKVRSFTGQSDPYVVINCGSKHSNDNNHSVTNTLNPVFGKMYEFQCCLPEDYLLTVSMYNHEALSPDDLIGSTAIDLEDRIYSKHRASVGLATDYQVTGLAKWRDCIKPSAILEEVCLKNHIPAPIFLDNNTVIVNGVQYKDTDQTNKTYISASECKENICLDLLHKWQTLPYCGYHLVPEHVETRSLLNPDKPGGDQGKIQMWVDIFPLDTGMHIPLPVDITPRKVEDYELRLTVWTLQGIRVISHPEYKKKDVYIKAWIGSAEQAQYTDINHINRNGEAIFNWRMILHFQYQHAERTMILKEKGPYTEVEEHLPPVLILQVIDSDPVASDECLGTITLDLNSIPRGCKLAKECKLHALDISKRVNLFTIKNIRGWWSLKSVDPNTGAAALSGMIDLELSLMTKEMAIIMPAGLGRDPPFPLLEPCRREPYQEMEKSSLLESILSNGVTECVIIGIILLATVAVASYWEFPSFLISSYL